MLKRIALITITGLMASLAPFMSPPANAVTYVDVVAGDVTVKNGCKDAPIDITGDWLDGEVTVSVLDPYGDEIAYDSFSDTTGVLYLSVSMCDYDAAGTYSVNVDVYDYSDDTMASGYDTFRLTKVKPPAKAKSRILMKRKHQGGKYSWIVAGKLLRNGHAYNRQRVFLAAKIQGDWYKIDAAKTRKGLVGWQFKPNRFRWCFYYKGNSKTKPSVSKVFRTPAGHGRVVARSAAAAESLVQHVAGVPVETPQRHLTRR